MPIPRCGSDEVSSSLEFTCSLTLPWDFSTYFLLVYRGRGNRVLGYGPRDISMV